MNSEFALDLCFTQKHDAILHLQAGIEEELEALFVNNVRWHLEAKTEDGLDVVVVEVKGRADWKSTEEAVNYLEDKAGSLFWDTIKGLRIKVTLKEDVNCCRRRKQKETTH